MRLWFRTQASARIGMGHFMRCFALAEAARARDIRVTFLLSELDAAAGERMAAIGADGVVTGVPVASEGDLDGVVFGAGDWLVVDSYDATTSYLSNLNGRVRVAVFDDLNALSSFDADLLINPAQAAPAMDYAAKTRARLLLGADYALIRSEFIQRHRPDTDSSAIAVMFGGSDPLGLTAAVAERLHDALPGVVIKVIAGPANAHVQALMALSERLPRVRLYASPSSVAAVLAGADLVVTAAGGSVGEVAAMALPALVLVAYDNQKAALAACPYPVLDVRIGLPDYLAAMVAILMADPAKRRSDAARAHALVDGRGPARILEAMLNV